MQPLPNNQVGFVNAQNVGIAAAGMAGFAGATWQEIWARAWQTYEQLRYQLGEERARRTMLERGYRPNGIGGYEPDPNDPRWWPSSTPAPNVAPRNYGPTPADSVPSAEGGKAVHFAKEWKAHSHGGTTGAAPPTLATFVHLSGLGAGTDINQRIGRRVVWKHILLNFRWSLDANGVTNNFNPRMLAMVVYDKQANGSTPVISDILDHTFYSTTDITIRPLALKNRNRFVLLKKIIIEPRTSNYRNSATASYYIDGSSFNGFYVNCETIYSGTGSASTDVASGSLWFVTVSSADDWFVEYCFRGRFTD